MLSQPQLTMSFFLNDTATTEIYTLSLHDALPIYGHCCLLEGCGLRLQRPQRPTLPKIGRYLLELLPALKAAVRFRSEEHTSELQSSDHLVCRLLLEKKKKNIEYSTVPQYNVRRGL